jgi:predicted RNA binding protein YcfA (HicA-like mRNA interferase family)
LPKIPGVNHLDAVRALEKAGFRIVRQGKHVVMSNGQRIVTVPRHNPVNAFTMGGIARDAGLSVDLVGAPIAPAKLNQATASAIAACDAADGVADGILDDPRKCKFSATANICGSATAPATDCLTPQEAAAIDKIWDGPRNPEGKKIWFGLGGGEPGPAGCPRSPGQPGPFFGEAGLGCG